MSDSAALDAQAKKQLRAALHKTEKATEEAAAVYQKVFPRLSIDGTYAALDDIDRTRERVAEMLDNARFGRWMDA